MGNCAITKEIEFSKSDCNIHRRVSINNALGRLVEETEDFLYPNYSMYV